MYLGTTPIKQILLGLYPVKSIWLGTSKIWESTSFASEEEEINEINEEE
jgi:hypothetical protein